MRRARRNLWRGGIALAAAGGSLCAAIVIAAPGSSEAGAPRPTTLPAVTGQPVVPLADAWTKGETKTLAAGVVYTRWTEKHPHPSRPGPRVLDVVRADPGRSPVTLDSTSGMAAGVAEPTSAQLASVTPFVSRRPIAGVNGGYFKPEPAHPDLGVSTIASTGIAARNGVLYGASCWNKGAGNVSAVLRFGMPYISRLRTNMSVALATDARTAYEIDDVNRNPGRVPGCRREEADQPTADPAVFRDPDEIVVFTSDYGVPLPKPGVDKALKEDDDAGFEVVLDARNVVTAARAKRGGRTPAEKVVVPEGGRVLQGVGAGGTWLSRHARVGVALTITQTVTDLNTDRPIPLDASVDIVNGVHRLLRDGELPNDLGNPCKELLDAGGTVCTDSRTALGTDITGATVLATLTGGTAEDGALLPEFATLLKADPLHLVDAINLDGGGSTTLMIDTHRVTVVTDKTNGTLTERPVFNAIYLAPRAYGLQDIPEATPYTAAEDR
ncbi:phosphodiester glycosidase family protein [Embleya sp. NBC_00896]|uniref:phosphodiester glycosidase family protein n=1 Tax=Embleya sp. NBC_00896 TaxID=2975961 RepID=UPI00386B8349|nr:phosphodiester glycosidase family protein [Embleya sp. NBC_00896]